MPFQKGNNANPSGKGGFNDRPQDRGRNGQNKSPEKLAALNYMQQIVTELEKSGPQVVKLSVGVLKTGLLPNGDKLTSNAFVNLTELLLVHTKGEAINPNRQAAIPVIDVSKGNITPYQASRIIEQMGEQ